MKKTGYQNDNLPNFGSWFNWGLHVEDIKDLFFVTGHSDLKPDRLQANFPNDPAAQMRFILQEMERTFSQAGYTKHNIICTNWCVTKEVTAEQTESILAIWGEYIAEVEPKPAVGTWKRIHGLISPDMMVELEMILAR